MDKAFPTAQAYAAERARFPARQVVDLQALQREATEAYRNEVVLDCNDACLRMAVFEGQYRWHHHPATDELFLVVAGQLHIEFDDGAEPVLYPSQCAVVPAGTVHRTRAVRRTVNLTFERQAAETAFVDGPACPTPAARLVPWRACTAPADTMQTERPPATGIARRAKAGPLAPPGGDSGMYPGLASRTGQHPSRPHLSQTAACR